MLTPANKTDLATAIENRNPYSFLNTNPANQGMTLPANWQSEVEEDAYVTDSWKFRGQSLRIKKSIRIPYNYQDAHGNSVREYLVIGYEGSGSD
jgi:hypothetical protein